MKEFLLNKIQNMTDVQLVNAVYRDTLTGVWNRQAFLLEPACSCVVLIDCDSLKWVNDNLGHRNGDAFLKLIASELETLFPDKVYRVSGDEFVICSEDCDETEQKLKNTRFVSYGIGSSLEEADINLHKHKTKRTIDGRRAERGCCPPWADDIKCLIASLQPH